MSQPRSRLLDFVMTLALVAICVSFTQVEGCGQREELIETIAFSPDDSQIAVTKLNARDSLTPFKHYIANVSRTISWLNAGDGESRGIVQQDFRPGDCGPAFHLWWSGRTSVVCSPANGQLAAAEFGGGDVTIPVGHQDPFVLTAKSGVSNLAISKSGRFIAGSGQQGTIVWDTQTHHVVMQVGLDNFGFLGAARLAFTDDEESVITANRSGVCVRNLATANKASTIIDGKDLSVNALATAPNNSLIICTYGWVRRYDRTGTVIASLVESGARYCSVSAGGGHLAVARVERGITLFDMTSNEAVRTIPYDDVTALALSSDGRVLAVGNAQGRVTLIDTATGQHRWDSSPPGRYRWSCTASIILVLMWCVVAWIRTMPFEGFSNTSQKPA